MIGVARWRPLLAVSVVTFALRKYYTQDRIRSEESLTFGDRFFFFNVSPFCSVHGRFAFGPADDRVRSRCLCCPFDPLRKLYLTTLARRLR
ncbi:hypothetical protein MLD38_020155 [Melastoma candidum]|uniref:Uncharacterized protein n=1 Tax=Melastoma candidum TaxID=119954 RepID=A0ACB9QFT6_9MYRT|nr:hypothetical protein MLD38_020155 [Melastoma candidum]